MDKERIHYYDSLKFFLITTVVAGHFSDAWDSGMMKSVFLFIYAFHMPLFFFVSGQFHKNTRVAQKVACFLALYLLNKAAIFAVRAAFGKEPVFELLSEGGEPWYMFATAVFILVTYLLRDVDKRFLLVMSLFLACMSGYDATVGDGFILSRCIVFYPFYLAGVILPRDKVLAFTKKRFLKILALLILLLWAFLCLTRLEGLYFLRRLFVGRHPYSAAVYPYGFLYRLLCTALAVLLGGSVMLLIPHGDLGVLTVFGQRTLQVFFWHRSLLYALYYLGLSDLVCQTLPGRIGWLLFAVGVTFLLSLKPFSFPTETVMRFQKPAK